MDEHTNPTNGPRAAAGATEVRRLSRRIDHKRIAGVAAGLGDYFSVDPVLFRIAFVVTTFAGGLGLIAYGLSWLLLPAVGDPAHPVPLHGRTLPPPSPGESRLDHLFRSIREEPAWVGVGLLILGVVLIAGRVGPWPPSIVWGVALIGLGVLLYRQGREERQAEAPPGTPPLGSGSIPPPPPPAASAASPASSTAHFATATEASSPSSTPAETPAADTPTTQDAAWSTPGTEATSWSPPEADFASWSTPTAEAPVWSAPPAQVPVAPAPPAVQVAPRVPKERSMLGWVTFGTLLLAVGTTAFLEGVDVIHLSVGQYLAMALGILGLGLLVGAWFGRARWLIVPGLLLMPFVLVATLIHVPFSGGFGYQYARPIQVTDVLPAYHRAGGELVLDLRDLTLGEGPVAIRATMVAGRILLLVPESVAVHVHARAGAGQVSLFGETFDGLKLDVTRTLGLPGSRKVIDADLEASFGQVEVRP